MSKKDETEQEQAPFAAWLRDQNSGRLHTEMTEKFHELVEAVRDTGKKGSISLTISVGPFRGDTDMLSVDDRVVTKKPVHDRKTTLWYPDANNTLHRNDPRQDALDFARVMED